MTTPRGRSAVVWARRTWEELPGDFATAAQAAILPVGATEQHGPHLGCGMDTMLADRLSHDVSCSTGVPVLPALPYGCSLGHSLRWPGTIAIDPLILTQVVVQIGTAAHRSGVRRLFLVNAHVGNAAPLRCALEMLRAAHDDLMVALVNTATLSERVRARHVADAEDWHANEAETSLTMALDPGMVRQELAAGADDEDRTPGHVFAHPVNRTSRNGVTGAPSRATREAGEELYRWMVEDLAAIVAAGLAEMPPLPHGYAERAAADTTRMQR